MELSKESTTMITFPNWFKKSTKPNVHNCSIIQPNKTI